MALRDYIIEHLEKLGGHASLKDLYASLEEDGRIKKTKSFKASVRKELEDFSSDSKNYKGRGDFFYSMMGIGKGEWGIRHAKITRTNLDLTNDDSNFVEGRKKLVQHLEYERNHYLTTQAKKIFKQEHHHLYCEICGFDFQATYGELGKDFIEAHHVVPLSERDGCSVTKISDFVMLCSNCHSMIHRRKPWLKREHLLELIRKNTK